MFLRESQRSDHHSRQLGVQLGWCLHATGEREREREGGGGVLIKYKLLFRFFVFQESNYTTSNDDVYISYLPLAHMMERICQAMLLQDGGKIGFYRGDVKLLIEDIQALRPTVFVSVPRLLNRVYDKVGV